MNKISQILLAAALLLLTACGGSSSSDNESFSAIAGVWDLTEDYGNGEIDEYYLVIDNDGDFKVYDYLGDSFDMGANCYYYVSARMTSVGNDRFSFAFVDDEIEIMIRVVNNNLELGDEQSFGVYPRAMLSESDFSPICSSNKSNDTENVKKSRFTRH